MFGLRLSTFACLAMLISCIVPGDAVMPSATTKASEIKRAQPILAANDAAMDTIMADNNIRISNSKIVLGSQDKKALLKAIADAVLAQQIGLGMASDDNDDAGGDDDHTNMMMKKKKTSKATRGTPITVVTFPVSRGAFLYYAPDSHDASQNVVRLGWRYALADWKLYRALIAPNACEVKRVIGDYYYC